LEDESAGTQEFEAPFDVEVAIYGRGRTDVLDSIEKRFGVDFKDEVEHQWVAPRAAKRAITVTASGVKEIGYADHSGECTLVSLIVAVIVAIIVFLQLVVFLIVLVVLTIFTGGAALKYTKATYMTAPGESIEPSQLEAFTKDQILTGRFVMVKTDTSRFPLDPITKASTRASQLFRWGIVSSVAIAFVFLAVEAIYYFLNSSWYTDFLVLLGFGLAFLFAIIITDIGVVLRRRLRGGIESGYVDGPIRVE
jgi:hypothetical protein